MNLLIHNLKVAFRNLNKYKLQTIISIASVAIGIVTLSLTHSFLNNLRLPALYDEPYCDRAYSVEFKEMNTGERPQITHEIIRALKGNGSLRNAEKIAVPNGLITGISGELRLSDSTIFKGSYGAVNIDPEYPGYSGMRSAITGKKIRKLKSGEAIISETYAKSLLKDKNPIGASIDTPHRPTQATIVDVFVPVSTYEQILDNDRIYYSVVDEIEENDKIYYYAIEIDIVLREGSSESQLLQEINDRIKPLGLVAEMSKAIDKYDINMIIGIRLLIYLIGSLILLAAIIGFLRIQIQLFWIRRREISLRVVNGATRTNLLGLLLTETSITIGLSMILALWLGGLLEQFIDKRLGFILREIVIGNLWSYTLVIGGGLIAVCCMIAWITLLRICKSTQSLAANMRRSRSHFFRNVMLGVQTTISLIFVCATLILVTAGDKLFDLINLPDNDDFYKECLFLRLEYANGQERLLDEIERLPDLDKMVMFDESYHNIMEISQNPDVMKKLQNRSYHPIYQTLDTTTLSLRGINVEWFNRDIDHNRCMLLHEKLYNQFLELGILDNNTLSFTPRGIKDTLVLPIAGIIKNIPYDTRENVIVAICNDLNRTGADYILAPKAGAVNRLALSVNETIQRLEPSIINSLVSNYREKVASTAVIIETFRTGGWILGIVSLIICAMSIYSTITLDTRARIKEVAIRKINGAKSKDIYLIFGKVYITIMTFAVVIAIPACSILNTLIENLIYEVIHSEVSLSPVGPIILGILVVSLLVSIIVGWQTYRVIQVDPAKIIAKE